MLLPKWGKEKLVKELGVALEKFKEIPLRKLRKLRSRAKKFEDDPEIKKLSSKLNRKAKRFWKQLDEQLKPMYAAIRKRFQNVEDELEFLKKVFPPQVINEMERGMTPGEFLKSVDSMKHKYERKIYRTEKFTTEHFEEVGELITSKGLIVKAAAGEIAAKYGFKDESFRIQFIKRYWEKKVKGKRENL
jgi:hypothetical protein